MAKRPVLGQGLHKIDEDILGANAGILSELFDYAAIERLLLGESARVVDGNLNYDEIIATRDSKISGAAPKICRVMLRNQHEEIILGHIEGLAHGLIKPVKNRLPIGNRLSPTQ